MMKAVLDNPYRIVGLLVGASAKEQDRQIKRLKQYIEAEQDLSHEDDYSFPYLGDLTRTSESVDNAAAKLHLDSDKLSAALFWFYSGNPITDEPALDALKDSRTLLAASIWLKKTASGEVTEKNCSAFQNLSTLLLCQSLQNNQLNETVLEQGIRMKLQFLDSDFVGKLKFKATDETFKVTRREIQLAFLNTLYQELEQENKITYIQWIDILSKQKFSAKEFYLNNFIQRPIEQIEKTIESVETERKANKSNTNKIGNELYLSVENELKQVQSVLGTNHIKYTSVADKVAEEMLLCGMDYFSLYRDTETDPSDISMDLFTKANNIAIGSVAKQKCQENIESLQKWIDDKLERDKKKKIEDDLQYIVEKIKYYQNLPDTINNAKDLMVGCKLKLQNIENVLGDSDDFYLEISSAIVSNVQKILVNVVNNAQDNINNYVSIENLKTTIKEALSLSKTLGDFNMTNELRSRYNNNQSILQSIANQLGVGFSPNTSLPTYTKENKYKSEGSKKPCYIATMAYGDFDHPQVLVLRQFRDNTLDKSALGKWFIKVYYHNSPKLVEKLKDKKTANNIIRCLLDQLIKILKR